jgi:predicted nucleotidyltransferase
MPIELTLNEITNYARTARKRSQTRLERLEARRTLAWDLARRAAAILKEKYGATRVVVFGSLTRGPGHFYARSDVDLAVWGLNERLYFRAMGTLLELAGDIEIDLVEAEFARSEIQNAIGKDGVEL